MQVGDLYEVSDVRMGFGPDGKVYGPVLYLGEDVIERSDGVRIVNHAVLVQGQKRILDKTFLKFLVPLTTS